MRESLGSQRLRTESRRLARSSPSVEKLHFMGCDGWLAPRYVTLYRRPLQASFCVFLLRRALCVFAEHGSLLCFPQPCGGLAWWLEALDVSLRAFPRLTLRALREAAMGCSSRGAVLGACGRPRRNLQGELLGRVGGTRRDTRHVPRVHRSTRWLLKAWRAQGASGRSTLHWNDLRSWTTPVGLAQLAGCAL